MKICFFHQVKVKGLILKPGSWNLGAGHEEQSVYPVYDGSDYFISATFFLVCIFKKYLLFRNYERRNIFLNLISV